MGLRVWVEENGLKGMGLRVWVMIYRVCIIGTGLSA
jgi:hypothetical protein